MSSGVLSRSSPRSGEGALDAITSAAVRAQVEEIVASRAFVGSKRSQEFLQLVVEHALAGRFDNLRERMIGAEMFGRPIDYDTANDAIVRVKATDVRRKLAQHYAELTKTPPIRIELPTGSYTPVFKVESSPNAASLTTVENPFPPASTTDISPTTEEDRIQDGDTKGHSYAKKRYWTLASIVILVVLMLLLIASILHNRSSIHSIAVLPLENLSKDPDQGYFAEGVTGELIADLGKISSLRVISKTSTMTYKNTKKTVPEIARELKVDAVVEGSVLREDGKVRITIALISARTDQYIWGRDYVGDLNNVLPLQAEVAQSIANEIRTRVTPKEQERLKHTYSLNPEAQDQYLVGVYILSSGDMKNAYRYFQRSVDLDPNYAPAQAALADIYGWLGGAGWLPYAKAFQKQKEAALKAIELDGALPEGHAELASALVNLDWDWSSSKRELDQALELNPNSSTSHLAKAYYLAEIGELPAAVLEINRTVGLDPVSGRSLRAAALIHYYARHYDEALMEMQNAAVSDSSPPSISFPFGVIYAEKGMYKQAIESFTQQPNSPHSLGHLGNAYARSGDVPNALHTIASLEEYVRREGIGRYEIALVYAGLGDKDQAFAWLEKAFEAHDKGMLFLRIDPCLDPLRSDPRLQKLIERTGLA